MTYKFSLSPDAPEWLWWAYGAMVGGYALIKRGIAAVPQLAEIKKSANPEEWSGMIDFYTKQIGIGMACIDCLGIWLSGYHYASDKADAKQTALITAYQNSSMAAAKQYADELKKSAGGNEALA